jgi:hypothetical protein
MDSSKKEDVVRKGFFASAESSPTVSSRKYFKLRKWPSKRPHCAAKLRRRLKDSWVSKAIVSVGIILFSKKLRYDGLFLGREGGAAEDIFSGIAFGLESSILKTAERSLSSFLQDTIGLEFIGRFVCSVGIHHFFRG